MSDSPDKPDLLDQHGITIPKRRTLWSRVRSASMRTKAIFLSIVAALAIIGGALANIDRIINFGNRGAGQETGPDVKVFFAATTPKSDFELSRGGRTLVFVSIPRIKQPVDRLVFGIALVRPVNLGARSLRDVSITTMYDRQLWHPSLGRLERDSVTPIAGALSFDFEIREADDRWLATRTISRIDPMCGAPFPVCFLLEIHGNTAHGELHQLAKGELEIRVFATDWKGLNHVLDIRCVAADSVEEFIDSCRYIASSLRKEGYADVPVILANTGGEGVVASEGPTIIQADVHAFLTLKEGTLRDF